MSRTHKRSGRTCAHARAHFFGLSSLQSPNKHRNLAKSSGFSRRFETLENRLVLSAAPIAALGLEADVAYSSDSTLAFDSENDFVEVTHAPSFELDSGTFLVEFSADSVAGRRTLFSKDHTGFQDGGHLTIQIIDGRIEARLQSEEASVKIRSAIDSITTGESHHVAVSFGDEGFRLYVDGRIADAKVDFEQGIVANDNSLILGASTVVRNGDKPNLRDHFDGTISSFYVLSDQYNLENMAILAGNPEEVLTTPTEIDGVVVGTNGNDLLRGNELGSNNLQGGYRNDKLIGTSDDDRLDGGYGKDVLNGGKGNDLIISRSDGSEPIIEQEYDQTDDPEGEVNPRSGTLYGRRPIAGDDLLIGGDGADTFRFEILINAKERILFKHLQDDGTIDWQGVTGENRQVHDHWVDRIGNDVIRDFNRAEGDKIEVVGHTVDVYKVTHHDSDDDGVLDMSIMHVQSNQGNAGAHNKDQLGLIFVYGDLVRDGDYDVHAHANLGIIETIDDLGEALAPSFGKPETPDDTSRWQFDQVNEAPLPEGAIFAVGQPLAFNGEKQDYFEIQHSPTFELDSGTFALEFTADQTEGRQTLFSKDHRDFQDGGHLTAQLVEDRVEVRLQSAQKSVRISSAVGSITAGENHHVAVSFGVEGFRLYVDGLIADAEVDFQQGIAPNDNSLVLGASTKVRDGDNLNPREPLAGTIHSFAVYGEQFDLAAMAGLAGLDQTPLAEPTEIDGVLVGTDRRDFLNGDLLGSTNLNGGYRNDELLGTDGDDRLDGGHGEDVVNGGKGNDLIISRSDGREPLIAQDYDENDDPNGEVNPDTRTLYADQPIRADDLLIGGEGADTFRFEILINAKERILFKHLQDDGTIDWQGVTGENRQVHDHWVDRIGNDVIRDFNRAEGDKIEVVGHTVGRL